MIGMDKARGLVLNDVRCIGVETAPLLEAVGRALAETVVSPIAVPSSDNSAMDGIAVRSQDTTEATRGRPVRLTIEGTVKAGDAPTFSVAAGSCLKVMTGAVIPEDADAVIPKEDVIFDNGFSLVFEPASSGTNIRPAGEDLHIGQTVFEPGEDITPAHVGVLASIGRTQVEVGKRPRISVLVTGSELVEPDEALEPGKVRNSNGPSLVAAASLAGARIVRQRLIGDDKDAYKVLLGVQYKF